MFQEINRRVNYTYRSVESRIKWMAGKYYYRWPRHTLLIVGLPKSGTSWLAKLLEMVPGYTPPMRVVDPDNCMENHDICDPVFANLPRDSYIVLKTHTRYTPDNLAVLLRFNLRAVLMYRDLRDQCVSGYFHVLHDPKHRHHQYYNEVSKKEGLTHRIEIALDAYVPWIRDWLAVTADFPDNFRIVRYEDLLADPLTTLSDVLKFYDICLSAAQIEGIVSRIAGRTKFDLPSNLRKATGTARKGIVGDWRNHFTDEHVNFFKKKAGDFLIELGYEKDSKWSR